MGHRYYDPAEGRFITRDPMGYGGGINLYGFAGNDPVNESDPQGTSGVLDWLKSLFHVGLKPGTPTIGSAAAEKRREIQDLTSGSKDDANVNSIFRASYQNHLSEVGPAVSGGLATIGGIIVSAAASAPFGGEGVATEQVGISTMHTLSLAGSAWRKTTISQEGLVYVLQDATTGEVLTVGQTTAGKFIGRFEKYVTAETDTTENSWSTSSRFRWPNGGR